ncbi:ubiquitin carboxyl-terminal hydrolase 15 isoform X1 [Rhipicephalus microplus]|uniref:ubiquitin carboxyl-terminal hydrolase 15 isoform X1 n=1 Tax=Rhipicephalus microplus TaxID=6941 RepID=UPI003F6C7FF0
MADGGGSAPDLETQRTEIANLFKKALKKDDLWYMVDKKWFNQWKRYVGYDSWDTSNEIGEQTTHPGPIDNSPLLREDNSGEIRDHLIEDLDYLLVPQEAWDKMIAWYGLTQDQSPLPRKVIEIGLFVKNCKVEVYPMELKLCTHSNSDQFVIRRFSKVDTIAQVEKDMRAIFKVETEKETRVWNRCSSNTYEHLSDRSRTIQDIGLYPSQILLLEERNDDGSWPRQVKSSKAPYTNSRGSEHKTYGAPGNTIATRSYSAVSSSYNSYSGNYNYDLQGGNTPGLCGLGNIGNTCFMNSALQCMSNTPPLTEYFMTDRYLSELNDSNPLGMRGEIAKSYADLVKVMWSGNCSSVIPRPFKMAVGRFAPQFSGFQQQDCQELMAFLLDGLHEDLNRVINKPYIELKDSDGRPDEVVAQEAWHNYLLRNNSIIVDIFHGLLKSTLVCPDCHKLSVTFDPFCYLSLPLPYKKEKPLELIVVRADPHEKPIKVKVTVSKMSTIQDVCNSISRLMDIPTDRLVVTEVHNHRFLRVLTHADQVDTLERSDACDVFVYEMPPSSDNSTLFLPVYMREKTPQSATNSRAAPTCHLFGYPFFVSVPAKDCTYDMLYERILNCLVRYVTPPKPGDDWCGSESMEEQNGEPSSKRRQKIETPPKKRAVPKLFGHFFVLNQKKLHNGQDELFADTDEEMPPETSPEPPPKECQSKRRRLFTLHCINENSSLNLASLVDNGQPLKLAPRTYLGADWLPRVRAQYFDEAKADDVLIHESVHQRAVKRQLQLRECLELFTTTEKLGAEDPWYCPTCRSHKQATKKFDLWSLPRVLIIHLKRFSYNRFWRDKIDTHVDFPVTDLCMDDYIINRKHERAVYDLIAVANHYGGLGAGHYTAYAKNKETHKWYHFDDSSVSSATEDNVVSKAAYVLFYMRRDSGDRTSPRKRSPAAAASTRQSGSAAADEERMDLS